MNNGNWEPFFKTLGDRLLGYKENRAELIRILESGIYTGMNYPFIQDDHNFTDIDPFTVIASVHRGIAQDNRIKILKRMAEAFHISDVIVPLS